MPGVDLVLPDFHLPAGQRLPAWERCVLTHSHEDHVGGLSFLLRELHSHLRVGADPRAWPESHRGGRAPRSDLSSFRYGTGSAARSVRSTWSSFPSPIRSRTASPPPSTPLPGVILHSGDFKIDLTPVDGRATDLAKIGALADGPGIRLLLSDSTNAEEDGHTHSERRVEPRCSKACSPLIRRSESSWPASPATSTACSRSPTPPWPTAGSSPRWAVR